MIASPAKASVPMQMLLAALAACLSLTSCSTQKANGKPAVAAAAAAAPVTVATAMLRTIPVEITAIGNVEAYSSVTVRARIDGLIERAYFKEGQEVKAGDLLFTLDPRSFQAAVQQAQANLARDAAQAKNASAQAKRYTELLKAGIVSEDQYDQFQTNAEALHAAVRADQAALANAQVQLSYCTIRSPIGGRTGALMVHPGNVVKNNDTALVTINQIQPTYVDFSVPQQNLPEIKREQALHSLKVEATIPPDTEHPETGRLSFINNSVDATTGTILLKGTFVNSDRRLWPGQFVNVSLYLAEQPNAVVVPSQAVQAGLKGSYTYVVKPDDTVELRTVETGTILAGETAIVRGIKAGETVVTDGQLRLFPGAKVSIKNPSSLPSANDKAAGGGGQ